MQRKRGELIPIGEAIGNLSPVQALRDAPPRRFTTSPRPTR